MKFKGAVSMEGGPLPQKNSKKMMTKFNPFGGCGPPLAGVSNHMDL